MSEREPIAKQHKLSFLEALKRGPRTLQEEAMIGVGFVMGSFPGLGMGYFETLRALYEKGDVKGAILNGVATVIAGSLGLGAVTTGLVVWRRQSEDQKTSSVKDDKKQYLFLDRFRKQAVLSALEIGGPIVLTLAGSLISVNNNEVGEIITIAGKSVFPVGVIACSLGWMNFWNKPENGKEEQI